jgi:pyridoxamine 5'-phosphate oxidase family protein
VLAANIQSRKGKCKLSNFTQQEIEYLQSQRLGRMATVDPKGDLHVVPVAFRYNAEEDTIDIGGHNITNSKKYRDALKHGRIAFVVDDVLPPWRPRFVEIRGTVAGLSEGGKAINEGFRPESLRLAPSYIVSLGINDDVVRPGEGVVQYSGRKVT